MNTVINLRQRTLDALATPSFAPFKIAEILPPDPNDPNRETERKTHWTATATALYMARTPGADRFGVLPGSYLAKVPDLVADGRRYPRSRSPLKYQDGPLIWQEADEAAAHDAGPAALHAILTLPIEGGPYGWEKLVTRFIDDTIVARGAVADWAIHALRSDDGEWLVHPHAHLLITCRSWRPDRQGHQGQAHSRWWVTKDQRTALSSAWCRAANLSPQPFTLG